MKVKFKPYSKLAEDVLTPPQPAKNFIPQWYKDTPMYIGTDTTPGISHGNRKAANTTIKACSPFLDALTFGYIWCLPVDLEIRKNYEGQPYYFRWRTDGVFLTEHTINQAPLLPKPLGGEQFVMKWMFDFVISTPPGYSTYFTHPLNRHELPFRTFSGVVDTDKFDKPVHFPFQLMDLHDDINIIKKGTPVVQIIPFKRESWDSQTERFDELYTKKTTFEHYANIVRSYKERFWSKKSFK